MLCDRLNLISSSLGSSTIYAPNLHQMTSRSFLFMLHLTPQAARANLAGSGLEVISGST
jgi:hypothetical protein